MGYFPGYLQSYRLIRSDSKEGQTAGLHKLRAR